LVVACFCRQWMCVGVEHFKQLLVELKAECSLSPAHRLTGATGGVA
jgi:hypothetical protein